MHRLEFIYGGNAGTSLRFLSTQEAVSPWVAEVVLHLERVLTALEAKVRRYEEPGASALQSGEETMRDQVHGL